MTGVPSGPGSRASHEAVPSSPKASIPNAARSFYETRPDLLYTGEVANGDEVILSLPWDDLTPERRAEFEALADLATKSPEQIGGVIAALGPLITLYSEKLNTHQQRFENDRRFLADLMAEYLKLTHFVARQAASALEYTSAPMAEMQSRTDGDQ